MKYIIEEKFEGLNFLTNYLIKGEYEICTFKNCNFSETDLSGFRFIDTEFIECNLSNSKLNKTSFQDVRFSHSKMLGLHFDSCSNFNLSIIFKLCNLNHSVFQEMNLSRVSFIKCLLHGVDFEEAEMKNTILQKCDLLDANFEHTNMEGADLRESINYRIDPEKNKLNGAKFSLPEVIGLLDKYNIDIEKP